MKTITIIGSGSERGTEHGTVLRDDIRSTVAALKDHLTARGHDVDTMALQLVSSTLCDVAASITPDLWHEVTATARGAQVPVADILLLTFLDEVWGMARRRGCSVMARRRPSGAEVGQTMDLPAWTVGRVVVVRSHPDVAPPALIMSYPGMIGLCGANAAGLAVAVNALDQLGLSEEGLGVALVVRHLLSLETIHEAEHFLSTVPHAAGQAYTLIARDRVVTYEAGPGHFARVSAADTRSCLHTNHLLSRPEDARESSAARLRVLQEAEEAHDDLESALSGAVVLDGSRYDDPNTTFAAFTYSSGQPGVHVIDGADLRDHRRNWTMVPFRP
jgi:predicted choloylglycine hydrolase